MKVEQYAIPEQETLAWGAESRIYRSTYLGYLVIVKHRFPKKFREPSLDYRLRRSRTLQEVRLLYQAATLDVKVPRVLDVQKSDWKIIMHEIQGKPLRILCQDHVENLIDLFREFGDSVGRLHGKNIIHGDLTTSNALVDDSMQLWLIDFGLGRVSTHIEDQAVDLLVLKHTLRSSHFSVYEDTWKAFLDGYEENNTRWSRILKRMDIVEDRIRYSH